MDYNFRDIEKKWQENWENDSTIQHSAFNIQHSKPKYYVLDMFPYPSGAGLHVGHPLGYIASDIYSRFKRLKGFNVLHPMGWDAFGLPAEQYAIQTGQHPAITTEQNIARYRKQMDMLGLSYDWNREVKTSDPKFYKWTQWIFLKLFKSWYNNKANKAESLESLVNHFEQSGAKGIDAACAEELHFSSNEWKNFSEKKKSDVLFNYRLAYLSEAWVNWCPALGTVLANDEVKDGVSERGGYPVERKLMPQWSLRMTAYADRLLNDLDTIDWSESIKEVQRNWIGRSEGSSLQFKMDDGQTTITVFTTRPDTVFGASFITLAPENELVNKITTPSQRAKIEEYIKLTKSKTERERQAEVKRVSGEFTGAYAIHPFTGNKVPVWVGDYVLAGYGTGAVMGVPAHDSRDHAFAKHFNLDIKQVIEPTSPPSPSPNGEGLRGEVKGSYDAKEGHCINSDFLNGLEVKDAIKRAIEEIEKKNVGKGKINFRLRDAAFGRQRYWGEPIPIYYKDGIPTALDESELPLVLPEIDKFQPTETGDPPLARATNWKYKDQYNYEYTTMPGWAGSSWYYLRYMDPNNDKEFASKEAIDYWQNIDLYIGGAEHSTGHLLYFRFWTKFLYDLGLVPFVEPAKKLVNQGMIQGVSAFRIFLYVHWSGCALNNKWRLPVIHVTKEFPIKYPDPNIGEIGEKLRFFYFEMLKKHNQNYAAEIEDWFSEVNERMQMGYTNNSRVSVEYVSEKDELDIEKFRNIIMEHSKGSLIPEFFPNESIYICRREVEKMSKSKFNVINPDSVIEQYGADTLRMYEMFLGPLELSKPWNTQGISGVHNFLRRFWNLFFNDPVGTIHESSLPTISDEKPSPAELKILHKTIKKIEEDIERLSLNTAVSAFMICLNELNELKCNKRAILEPLVICLSPFAPYIAEELWSKLGHETSVLKAPYPTFEEKYLIENTFAYPVSFNGKTRFMLELPLTHTKEQVEKEVLSSELTLKWTKDNPVKKVIVVHNKIVNVVI